MAGITGLGTTFNLPNYTGELFGLSPTDTPILASIGGLTGGKEAKSEVFSWSTYDLRDAATNRQRLEGADAPTAEARVRGTAFNVVEIHQEALSVSYTKQSTIGQVDGSGSSHPNAGSNSGTNNVTDEVAWQLEQHIKQVARDVEKTFISGTFQEPADNDTPRKTRGLVEAITTNAIQAEGDDLEDTYLLNLMQEVYESGGIMEDETRTLVCGPIQKRKLTTEFIKDRNYQQLSRTVGGVAVDTILTDFGTVNVMLDRHMPTDTVLVLSLEQLSPVFLNVPGKGHFFVEQLAKTGSADKFQLYGEIGLEYGNEQAHGKITELSVVPS